VKALAVVLAGLAAALGVGGRQNLLRARLGFTAKPTGRSPSPGGSRASRPEPGGPDRVSPRMLAAAAAAGSLTGGLVIGGPGFALLAAAAAGLVVAVRSRTISARRFHHAETKVSEACLVLAAELRSGALPREALVVVAAEWPDLFGVAARRAAVGGEVSSALRAAAGSGRSALASIAAGWEVSERTGAALSDVLTAVADSLRADAAARREAEAQLAAIRVTGRLLALLPVGTLVLLSGGDVAPFQFLLDTTYGWACLAIAMVLVAFGLWWIDRLVRTASRSGWS